MLGMNIVIKVSFLMNLVMGFALEIVEKLDVQKIIL